MKKKILLIVAAIVFVGIGVAGGYFFLGKGGGEAQEEAPHLVELQVGELTTNLADANGRRLIQVEVGLVVEEGSAGGKGHGGDEQEGLTEIRDAILEVLRSKEYRDVIGADGMKKLKDDIRTRVNETMHDGGKGTGEAGGAGKVVEVHFSKFLVQ